MPQDPKKLLLCTCEGTMPVDAGRIAKALGIDPPPLNGQLCRAEIENLRRAAQDGAPVLVACAQEAEVFANALAEIDAEAAERLRCADIRDRAGWSRERAKAGPKMAALLAEASLDIAPTAMVPMRSEGVTVVHGRGQQALDAAARLADRLDVICLLTEADDALPPRQTRFPVFTGRVRKAEGHLGAFSLQVDGFAAANPSSRGSLNFGPARNGAELACDIIVDISGGTPFFPAAAGREGYLRADPGNPALVQQALFDATDLVGEFDKPRYVRVESEICAHSRNSRTGCTRCLDVCPSGAIAPAGEAVGVDASICCGNGSCASVCPTGAITYAMPGDDDINERLRVLLSTFHAAGGREPVLLVHDQEHGAEMIALSARLGDGLPAHVLPFAVHAVGRVGIDLLLTALAYGAAHVLVLAGPRQEAIEGLEGSVALANTLLAALGYGDDRCRLLRPDDPAALETELYGLEAEQAPEAAEFPVRGARRPARRLVLKHLYRHAPQRPEAVPLSAGAPFGAVEVDAAKCTLCMACVGACPTRALGDNKERPQLTFRETACVQCGLCRDTCPEGAITLTPRLAFTEAAEQPRVMKEDDPFECVRCGKPFATASTIERMLERLAAHPMFSESGRLELLKMCEDCRVIAQADEPNAPFAAAPRPRTRTTEDYLREREAKGNNGPAKPN